MTKTTIKGYINRNEQENLGGTDTPGTHPNQKAYAMKCRICGHRYEANGCDIHEKKCPGCQDGK